MSFTSAQQQAIESDAREIMCVAGAGAGKTRTMVERIARLLVSGTRPSALLVLTFTRRAAREMRERLIERLGGGENAKTIVAQITLGTFHAVAYKLLRIWGERLGYDAESLTIVPPGDADLILQQIASEFGYARDGKWRGGLSWTRLSQWRECQYTGGTPPRGSQGVQDALARIFAEYCNRLRGAQSLDFGLTLLEVKRLLDSQSDIREKYNSTIKHVFVDEAQDLDEFQHGMLFYFWPPASIFFVGDLRQSIYAWRSARPDLLRRLLQGRTFEVIDLDSCFRCSDRIVEAANTLIDRNGDELAAPMRGATRRRGLVEAFEGDYGAVVAKVKELQSFHAAGEIAVLGRTHRVLRYVQGAMAEAGVSCNRVGQSSDLAKTEAFSKLHAALRLVVNRRDRFAVLILAAELGLDQERIARLNLAAAAGSPIFDAYLQLGSNALGDSIAFANPEHGVELFIDAMSRSLPIDTARAAGFWSAFCSDKSIAEALEWYADFDSDKGEDYRKGEAVTLITAHAAKGLEWDAVIVAGLDEGVFPSVRSTDVLEERRLCYVAMTRARHYVGLHHMGEPSQFIGESEVAA